MAKAKLPRVQIAVFSMGDVRSHMSEFLIRACLRRDMVVGFTVIEGQIPHCSARNYAVKQFLAEPEPYDFLLMVDADILPHSDVLDMIQWNLPVVSAMCLVLGKEDIVTTASRFVTMDDGKKTFVPVDLPKDGTNPIAIDYVGAGCLLIRRDVLYVLRSKKIIPFAFDKDDDGVTWQGEDYHFCQIVRDEGYTVHLDRRFLCDHTKRVSLNTVNRIVYNHYKENTPAFIPT